MNPDEYQATNSYYDGDERISPMAVTAWDVVILLLGCVVKMVTGLDWLAKAHYNRLVDRRVIEMEMRRDLEAIAR